MIDHDNRIIHVSAVVLRHPETGEVLSVRKRGTSKFMQPGGKPEPGESALQAAVREIREELSVDLDPERMIFLGVFEADAAEIEELRWVDAEGPFGAEFAPLMTSKILPALRIAEL